VVLDVIQKIVYATSEEQYLALYDQLKQCAPHTVIRYFDTSRHAIRGEWCLGLKLATHQDIEIIMFIIMFFCTLHCHHILSRSCTTNHQEIKIKAPT